MQTQRVNNRISDFVEIEGKKLYYEVAGEGIPVVFIHAGFLDSGMWDDQWEAFCREYRVIRYDMRGFGQSEALQGPTSRRAELHALLNALQIKAAHLVGCSIGATTALDFAIEHPQMTLGVVLVNGAPSGFAMEGEPPANVVALIDAIQKRDIPRISEVQLQLWIDGPFRQADEVDAVVRQRAARMNQVPVRNFTWVVADMQPADPLTPPAAQQLHNVHAPTLVIAGALDDPQILRAADAMAEGIKGARKVIIPGAAHIPSMEKPAEFNRIVLEFLEEVYK